MHKCLLIRISNYKKNIYIIVCTFVHVHVKMQLCFVAPNLHKSYGYKRTPSLPSVGDRTENEKNENKRTERHVHACIPKNS